MGGKDSKFSEQELEDYQELTYFTRKEVLIAHERFRQLDPVAVKADKSVRLSEDKIMQIPELKVNPFADRIIRVFSANGDGSMSFEDYLDMMSVFSEAAPKSVKVEYAFRIYDMDDDDQISMEDIQEVVRRLTGDLQLTKEEMTQLVTNILDEADLDNDTNLSFAEFEHVISKAPDFVNSFRMRL